MRCRCQNYLVQVLNFVEVMVQMLAFKENHNIRDNTGPGQRHNRRVHGADQAAPFGLLQYFYVCIEGWPGSDQNTRLSFKHIADAMQGCRTDQMGQIGAHLFDPVR